MANAIQLISKRAKQLQKKLPRMQWKELIKKASAEYRGGKLGAVKKKKATKKKAAKKKKIVYRQRGTSDKKRDEERSAMKPGKRNGYYERRKNRSDMPGKLTGTNSYNNYLMLSRIKSNTAQVQEAERTIIRLKQSLSVAKGKSTKHLIRKSIEQQRKIISSIKHDTSMVKRLIR